MGIKGFGTERLMMGAAAAALMMGIGGARAADAPMAPTVETAAEIAQSGVARTFDIPAQDLNAALLAFTERAGLQVVYDVDMVAGLQSSPLKGEFTPQAGLTRLLAGTGLIFEVSGGNRVTLARIESGNSDRLTMGPVTVEGTAPGNPGSTENTESYSSAITSVGSKLPVNVREIPQSLSVVTRQRIEDKNYATLQEALTETTGVRVENYDDVRAGFMSRGYRASILRDGVPVEYSLLLEAAPDMAIYDRVEVLRGPAGLFQGAGEPGGSINLVRKKPLDHFQGSASALAGSWDNYRIEADVTGPLIDNGKLRGRFVTAYNDRSDFVDVHDSRKPVVYGTVEGDLGDSTTASLSVIYQHHKHDSFRGVPTFYTDGTALDLPRNTNITTNWADATDTQGEIHLDIKHSFSQGIEANINARTVQRTSDVTEIYVNSAVNPTNGNVSTQAYNFVNTQHDASLDGNLSIPFHTLGQEQKVIVGGDYFFSRLDRAYGGGPSVTMNAFNPDYGIDEPDLDHTVIEKNDTEQYGLYAQARLKPGVDWATIVLGGRETWWEYQSRDIDAGSVTANLQVDGKFTPYGGLILDVTPELSVYASYTSIFEPQTSLTPSGDMVDPREGMQYEAGIKSEFMDGALIGHFAAYWMEDENRATRIDGCIGSLCFEPAGLVRSQGVEAEISGEVLPGLQLLAGYAYTNTKYIEDPSNEGEVFSTNTPKHMVNLAGRYAFREGMLDGLTLGGGARVMTSYFYDDTTYGRNTQNAYAVFDAFVGYKLTESISAQLAVNNILDKVYYERLERASRNNRYGTPRNVMFTIRGEF